ncbi:hypothetical protein PR048_016247 [Dryococelus australis]|uniref:HAT C-terminal dimerisation domain-containing protein n=1 Tax=Dryococelus australis TaxID=614101 RepID=A0ABQ9HJD1_9NEOP|nr:hypothetical protein PR048_016247 [Dryococelus australis]
MPEDVSMKSSNLVKYYHADLEDSLSEELLHFIELLKTELLISNDSKSKQELVEVQLYRLIRENSLECCFPNIESALRIYLPIMVTNCTGERLFFNLKLIKNELRTTMSRNRLNSLTLMSIEHELLRQINVSDIINIYFLMLKL